MWVCINVDIVMLNAYIHMCSVMMRNVLSKMVWETRLVNQVEDGNWFQSGTWFRGKYPKMIWLKEDEKGGKCFQTLVLVKVVKDLDWPTGELQGYGPMVVYLTNLMGGLKVPWPSGFVYVSLTNLMGGLKVPWPSGLFMPYDMQFILRAKSIRRVLYHS